MDIGHLLNDARLPSPAPVVLTLYEVLERGNAEDIARVIASDPALAARVLRLANSAFYGQSAVGSVREAVIRVGTVDVAALVLASEIMRLFRGIPGERFNMAQFWEHSLSTACYCQTLAPGAMQHESVSVWLCGLLHDIGKLLLARHCGAAYAKVLEQVDGGAFVLDAEQDVLGYTHAEVGEALLVAWRLPGDLATCAARHHDPYNALETHRAIVAAGNDLANGETAVGVRLDMTAEEIASVQTAANALYADYRQLFREYLR